MENHRETPAVLIAIPYLAHKNAFGILVCHIRSKLLLPPKYN